MILTISFWCVLREDTHHCTLYFQTKPEAPPYFSLVPVLLEVSAFCLSYPFWQQNRCRTDPWKFETNELTAESLPQSSVPNYTVLHTRFILQMVRVCHPAVRNHHFHWSVKVDGCCFLCSSDNSGTGNMRGWLVGADYFLFGLLPSFACVEFFSPLLFMLPCAGTIAAFLQSQHVPHPAPSVCYDTIAEIIQLLGFSLHRTTAYLLAIGPPCAVSWCGAELKI